MFDTLFRLERNSKDALYVQVYKHIKDSIESGKVKAHTKIPSIRQGAADLGLSRRTLENAYSQLLLEGYIYSKDRSGYYVSDIGDSVISANTHETKISFVPKPVPNRYFMGVDHFDFTTWRKCYDQVLLYENDKLLTEASPQGEYELRKEIAEYVLQARGVHCNMDRIVIGAGVQVLLGLLSVLLREMNIRSIAVENPGFTEVRHVFKDYYLDIKPIPITGHGLHMKELMKSKARVCYVSPTHQYPTGAIMPVSGRVELLRWAASVDGFIIEDDYDSELRYSGRPVPSLQGLDSGDRVIFLGSFSTILLPSVRISYMILPERFYRVYRGYMDKYRQTVSKTEQLVLAHFMKDGEFQRHLRRIRKKFSVKHGIVREALEKRLPEGIFVEDSSSGVHIPLRFERPVRMEELVEKCSAVGLKVRPITEGLLMFNFAILAEDKILEASDKLAELLEESFV
jgi:GntR family transcriptional regulator/MocR family aminotransferase